MSSSDGNTRDRNDPKPRLASPYHTTNVSGLADEGQQAERAVADREADDEGPGAGRLGEKWGPRA